LIPVATIMPPIRRRRYEIHERNRHGKYVWYFRRPGAQRVRLPDDYNSPAYIKAYNAAFAGELIVQPVGRPARHTLAWLIHQYRQSGHFKALRPATRRVRDSIFARLVETSGTQPFAAIKRQHIQDAMDAKGNTPFAANGGLKALRKLFEWAVAAGHIDHSPCDGVKLIAAKSDGFHAWTVAEVEQYRLFHPVGTRARLALDLLLFTGLRRSDAIRVGPQHVRDDLITIRTQKTGITVYLTIWPELAA
jgi:integrase